MVKIVKWIHLPFLQLTTSGFYFKILIQSVYETMVPKLVAEDIPLLQSLLSDVFPGVKYVCADMRKLKAEIKKVCEEMHLMYGEGEEQGAAWVDKVCMTL
jgi:dynein heavy chain 1